MKLFSSTYTMVIASIFLMLFAFKCDEELGEPAQSGVPIMKLKISPNKKVYSIGDTLWITGNVSSKVLNYINNDSILYEATETLLHFYKLTHTQTIRDYNADFAVIDFEIINVMGIAEKEDYSRFVNPEYYSYWDNLHRLLKPELSIEKDRYILKIGIIPNAVGSFALYCPNEFDVNSNNADIFYSYFDNKYNTLFVMTRYQSIWLYINENIFFFNVE